MFREKDGSTTIYMKNGTNYSAKLEEFSRLVSCFKSGETFVEFQSLYGSRVIILRAGIEGIAETTPRAYANYIEDRKLMQKEEALD